MAVEILKEKNPSNVLEMQLGATKEEGGTRTNVLKVGGDTALPFLHFEGNFPNKPIVAMEVQDIIPSWNDSLKKHFEDVWGDPAQWAQKCVEEYGADAIYLKLEGAHPDEKDRSIDECCDTLKNVLNAVGVPLIVLGSEVEEKDNELMPAIAEAGAGENLLIGAAEEKNYKTITASCMVHNHNLIARSPLDINICKQLNILITEMNLSPNKIAIDPAIGGLGYGIEYAYSILERSRQGALLGDKMMSMPILATIGYEAWKTKEASASVEEYPGWGDEEIRGIQWEAMTATSLLQSGIHIALMRHPKAVSLVKNEIDKLMEPSSL